MNGTTETAGVVPGGILSRGARRVEATREQQLKHFEGKDIASNADKSTAQIRKYCVLDEACQALMKTAMRRL